MHAIILIEPWQCLHTVTSMLNTRFSRIAQLILQQSSSPIAGNSVVAVEGCRGVLGNFVPSRKEPLLVAFQTKILVTSITIKQDTTI